MKRFRPLSPYAHRWLSALRPERQVTPAAASFASSLAPPPRLCVGSPVCHAFSPTCFEWCGGCVKRNSRKKNREKERSNMSNTTSGEFNKYIVSALAGPGASDGVSVCDATRGRVPPHAEGVPETCRPSAPDFTSLKRRHVWSTGRQRIAQSHVTTGGPAGHRIIPAKPRPGQHWDLTQLSAEAQAQARQEMAEAGWC